MANRGIEPRPTESYSRVGNLYFVAIYRFPTGCSPVALIGHEDRPGCACRCRGAAGALGHFFAAGLPLAAGFFAALAGFFLVAMVAAPLCAGLAVAR